MKDIKTLKREMAGETRAREAAEARAREAIIRAERSEKAERSLTSELDRAHRYISTLESKLKSIGHPAAAIAAT